MTNDQLMPERVLNLKRDLPDARDWPLAKLLGPDVSLPPSDNHLIAFEPAVRDQGQLGSCTGFMKIRLHRMARRIVGGVDPDLSPLFNYYNSRKEMGTIGQDSGASIRQAIQTGVKYGDCDELFWPYIVANWQSAPPQIAFSDALTDQITEYYTCSSPNGQANVDMIKQAIFNNYPVGVGVSVYQSFMGNNGGNIPMPASNEQFLGGHAITLDSYDDTTQRFGWINSWGTGWGNHGRGTIPYQYIASLGFDAWVVRVVEAIPAPPPPQPPQPNPPPPPPPAPPAPPLTTPRDQLLKATLPSTGWLSVGQNGQFGVEIKRRNGAYLNPRVIIPDLRKSLFTGIFDSEDLGFEEHGFGANREPDTISAEEAMDLLPDSPLNESQR